jgi:hypothetical protein
MSDATPLKWVYLTLPEPNRPILNIQVDNSEEFRRYELTRDHLFRLNHQIADALTKGRVDD